MVSQTGHLPRGDSFRWLGLPWLGLCLAVVISIVLAAFVSAKAHAQASIQASGKVSSQIASQTSSQAAENSTQALRVQLLWYHQSQFAGFYVAQARKHFENEGLSVELIEGGADTNPIKSLQDGKADIAISWLGNAWGLSTPEKSVTNIAQIFSGSALAVICRISAGVYTPKDIIGKKIGVWELGDEHVVSEMLRRLEIPMISVRLVKQAPNGEDLIKGRLPCVTAMTYNEYWKIMASGIPATDLLIVSPEMFGIAHVEDGLYVMTDRLASAEFRDQLTRFLQALRRGWQEARIAPTLAVETVQRVAPKLNREHQRHMLETVLGITPEVNRFGVFELDRYESAKRTLLYHGALARVPEHIWTHSVWNELQERDGKTTPLTNATKHYANTISNHWLFKIFLAFGVLTFALSGTLEAVNRGYDFWGRLILAFMSGLGGGTLRDFLIGGERMPLYYVKDLTLPLGVLILVAVTSVVTGIFKDIHKTDGFKTVKTYADIIGFSVLAIAGAKIAIAANMHWAWAPICAALTCAGGGMLRDIVVNQEPATFKGVIYEEIAIVGAVVFLIGLFFANFFENTMVPVLLSVVIGALVIVGLRLIVYRYKIRYPGFSS